jgi:DNA helicase-2/ATP-dependent DNA helicase PcrA
MVNLEELNPAQQSAVICCDAPSLVIAGAGSGKTRVLTYKIAWLMEQGMAPEHILALTFTNKAAKEMQERIALQVGAEKASRLWMGTFHSIFYRILRYEHELLGLSSNFTIYDQTDSKALIKTIVREMGLDEKVYKPGSVAGRISAAKNRLVMPEQYMASANTMNADRAAKVPATGEIYRRYAQRCRQAEAMDFDDLLLYTWLLFRDHPEVCRKYEERFQFVLVDEYQDTNYAQDQIVWQLTQHRQRVAVVGDDAQSIYSFRGANINNILRFRERYNGAKLFKLEQNYRSTQTIVNAASKLIAHNKGQIPKEVYSKKDVGDPIELMRCYSDIDEAGSVMKRIKELHNRKGFSFADIAILYRTNAQSRSFEEVLRKNAVPYRIYGGVSFYQRKEIKDAIAYFRLAVNPYDEEALRRVINYPARGIGQTTMDKLSEEAVKSQKPIWDVIAAPDALDMSGGTKGKLRDFHRLIQDLHELSGSETADVFSQAVMERSRLKEEINRGKEAEDISRQENMQELMDGIAAFTAERLEQSLEAGIANYLQEVSLMSDLDEMNGQEGSDGVVTMMTIHSAKGLEFRAVFVVGLEEELFPSAMALETPMGIEEERRLCYVAMTRAEEVLVFTTSRSRFRYGKVEQMQPSRFLQETGIFGSPSKETTSRPVIMPRRNAPTPSGSSARPLSALKPVADSRPLAGYRPPSGGKPASAPESVVAGDIIIHERFGRGRVVSTSDSGIDAKAVVDFENAGTKQLLLRFAKFQKVEG